MTEETDGSYQKTTEQMLYVHSLYLLYFHGPILKSDFEDVLFSHLKENLLLLPDDLKIHKSRETRTNPEAVYQLIRNLAKSHKKLAPSYFVEETATHYILRADAFEKVRLLFTGAKSKGGGSLKGENVILVGAPGTGKSFYLNSQFPNAVRTVFHEDYTNADFVGAYKPICVENEAKKPELVYRFVPGPFTAALVNALNAPEGPTQLVIEEINRGSAASIFGEMILLLDRDDRGRSEYSINVDSEMLKFLKLALRDSSVLTGDRIFIPANLSIYATYNSADESVKPLDSAFKRRWSFKYVPIDFSSCPFAQDTIWYGGKHYCWRDFAGAVNTVLKEHFAEDRLLGPFFLKSGEHGSKPSVSGKLLNYLFSDLSRFLDDRELIFSSRYNVFSDVESDYLAGKKVLCAGVNDRLEGKEVAEKVPA